ncbi:MAG TPA: molybdate ABC transporter substrate-binding protein [Ilumatobacteraceae bacterium]|nr:molybdate ABC transporter substrate-binding protein [Ilumatobacteraceae bacterium]
MLQARKYVVIAVAVLGLAVASCADDDSSSGGATAVSGRVTVFAAASLTAAFSAIGDAFKTANRGTNVTFNFASSSDLVTQINEGAAADVYASADEANMQKLVDAEGNAADPQVFATNSLQIIVQPGNPKRIKTLADLANPNILYVTSSPEVPIGKYAAQALATARVTVTPVSLEENVKGIVTKVTLGEADAGIVYTTDVIAAGDQAEGVDIPADANVIATYPIVVTKAARNPAGASAFSEFVRSDQGQKILAGYGFTSP